MKATTFKLIDAINREGLDNSRWGVVEDIESTKEYFGTDTDEQLQGQWLYLYRSADEKHLFIWETKISPDIRDTFEWTDFIEFYKI
ncbi:MAG: hypothetical protein IJA96_05645 [Alistipes sp.]|nr:hypothetical protein [Alistipes sp.]